jgi:outer membrane receptor protein involved in Fe transport
MRESAKTSRNGPMLRLLLLLGIASAATLGGAAHATDANAEATEPAASSGLEEIVVTATRREESISKVPISITALSQDALDARGIRDITEIVRFTPGMNIDSSGTNQISIRGISSSAGAGTTGIYIDDTPIQMRELGFNPDETLPKTFDLERVEVLRGPQGTLFGSGSEGGTIRYIMTQPSVTQDSTYVRSEASYTEYGSPSGEAGIAHGAPIIDGVLGYRASIWYRYDGGWINRVNEDTGAITEPNANYAGTTVARLALLYQPTDGLRITPSVLFQNKQQHDLSTYWPAYSDPAAGRFNNATPELIRIPDVYYLPALKVQFDFGHLSFFSNSSYYHRNETDSYQGTVYDLAYYQALGWPNAYYPGAPALGCGPASSTPTEPCSWYPLLDGSGVHLPPGFQGYSTPNTLNNDQRILVQEFRLQSNDPDARVKWTAGVYWSLAQEISIEQLNDPRINQLFEALYGVTADSLFQYQPNPPNGPYIPAPYDCPGTGYANQATPAIPLCDIYYNYNKSYDRQVAGYGEATTNLVGGLSLVTGLRYSKLGFSLDHYSNGYENYGPALGAGKQSNTAFTPRAGLNWQVDQSNLYYFTYSKGFRPGGFNPPLIPACGPGLQAEGFASGQAPQTYNSDNTDSYEIGAKNNIADRIRLASSIYYIKWNDIQQNVYIGGNCGLQFTDNLGTAVAEGFDLQMDADLGAGFTFEASVGYTSARFTKNDLCNAQNGTCLALNGDAISGNAAINYSPGTNPPWEVALGPQYKFKFFEHDAFVRVDFEYASRNPWAAPVQNSPVAGYAAACNTIGNALAAGLTPTTKVPTAVCGSSQYDPFSYSLPATSFTSARAGVKFGGWDLSAFCDNLFNKFPLVNYAQVQIDSFNPAGPPTPQQNNFSYRPRTVGITATLRL